MAGTIDEKKIEHGGIGREKRLEAIRILANAIIWLGDGSLTAEGSNDSGAIALANEALNQSINGY